MQPCFDAGCFLRKRLLEILPRFTNLMHRYIVDIAANYMDSLTEMTTEELVAVLQDRDSSDEMTTKQFLIT